jgi:U3 small nucleolar RNA-associated protein MPP10
VEDVIRQRIKDESWDDVERKVKPKEVPYNYRVTQPLNQEKSQLSLAEVYEEEYLKQTAHEGEMEEKEDERHTEIKSLMEKLFLKLDALSNFRYTPKPLKKDIKVVANVPALSMEEATPTVTNDRDILAPEEIQPKKKPYVIEETELTSTDKKRKRRKWKRKAHFMALKRSQREKMVKKLNPGLGNKYSKKDATKMLEKAGNTTLKDLADKDGGRKVVRTSTQMFSELQDKMTLERPEKPHKGRKKPFSNLKL